MKTGFNKKQAHLRSSRKYSRTPLFQGGEEPSTVFKRVGIFTNKCKTPDRSQKLACK